MSWQAASLWPMRDQAKAQPFIEAMLAVDGLSGYLAADAGLKSGIRTAVPTQSATFRAVVYGDLAGVLAPLRRTILEIPYQIKRRS